MSIYFTRHGQTDWNINMLIQGRIDVPLNEVGRKQAQDLAERMKDIHLDLIISSPLQRAIDTAKAVNKYHNVPIQIDNRVIEEYYGKMEGKPRRGEPYLSQRPKIATRYPGGESYFDVAYRIYDLLNELKATKRDLDILIVAHGGISRVFNSYFKDMENDEFIHYGLDNCELAKYEFVDRDLPLIVKNY